MSCLTAGDYARLNDILSTDVGDIEVNYENHGWFLREFPEDYSYSKWLPAGILYSQKRGGGSTSIKNILGNKWRDWRNLILFDGKTINEHLEYQALDHVAQAVAPPPVAIVVEETMAFVLVDVEKKVLVEVNVNGKDDAPGTVTLYDVRASSVLVEGGGSFFIEELAYVTKHYLCQEDMLDREAALGKGEQVLVFFENGTAAACTIEDWGSHFQFRGEEVFQKLTVINAEGVISFGIFNTDNPHEALLLNNGGRVLFGVKDALTPLFKFTEDVKFAKKEKREEWDAPCEKVETCEKKLATLRDACPKSEGNLGRVQGALRDFGGADKFRLMRFGFPMLSLRRLKRLQGVLGDIITAKENLESAEGERETMRGTLEKKPEKPATPPRTTPAWFATQSDSDEDE